MQTLTPIAKGFWQRARPLIVLLAVLGVTGVEPGCASDDIGSLSGVTRSKKKKTVTASDGGAGPDGSVQKDGENGGTYTKSIDNSGASFQVKDVDLLRSSVESCMGPGMLAISDEMLLPALTAGTAAPLPDAKIHFLLPTQYKAGDDILDKEKGNMVDQGAGPRTNVSADSLTDTYLRSLETVANVVAHNCAADKAQCQCGSKEQARAMLTRCLPGLEPNTKEMDEAASLLGAICGANGAEGMRKAVASMLSSYAFAAAR